ncbi:MAG: rod shape-determining protein MreD [Chloroflexi bacterium]|nr:rod shape-determining protein MreD [Chloroflexota bacterium]
MKYVIALAAIFFLTAFSSSALSYGRLWGVRPDLLLVFVACWAALRGQGEAMVVAPLAGFLRDLMTSDPVGTSALALAPIVLLAAYREFNPTDLQFLPALALVAVGTLAYGIISMTVLTAVGYNVPWYDALLRHLVPAVLLNVLVTPAIYLPLRWFTAATVPVSPTRIGPTVRL